MTFYQIGVKSGSFAQPALGDGTKFAERCSICGRGGGLILPLSIKFNRRNIPDFNFIAPNLIITDRVREVFENNSVRGVEFLDVLIESDEKLLQGKKFWHLHVTGRGKASPECRIELLSQCEGCGYREYSTWDDGLRVDVNTLGDFDIYRIEEFWGFVFVNEKVKSLIEKHNLVNVNFTEDKRVIDPFPEMKPRKR